MGHGDSNPQKSFVFLPPYRYVVYIGKELALWCAEAGFVVFAGCLKKESFTQFDVNKERLRIFPLEMDVTDDTSVTKAVAAVSNWLRSSGSSSSSSDGVQPDPETRVLHALVNNAGVGVSGFVDWTPLSEYQKGMEVNYFGMIRCTKAFLPIFKSQGINRSHVNGSRILCMTSVAGLMPGSIGSSPYAASKHAAQAFTESLRMEVACFDIQVASVNPSIHKTPMGDSVMGMVDKWRENTSTAVHEEYGQGKVDTIFVIVWVSCCVIVSAAAMPHRAHPSSSFVPTIQIFLITLAQQQSVLQKCRGIRML